jgi:predicted phosphodiesterase
MRLAALYDIHGNLPALEAVIADVRREGVDQLLVGGDVVPGPMPREMIEYLLALDIPAQYIRGNGDREVVTAIRGGENTALPESVRETIRWNAEQVRAHESLLAGWPLTCSLTLADAGEILFCHATPRNDSDIFTASTDARAVLPTFAGIAAPTIVCGHTHMQFDRPIGRHRVVNAGSVGMPFQARGAYWLLIERGIEMRRTDYDYDAAAARIRATAYPQAKQFATGHVLNPPAEAAMREALRAGELRPLAPQLPGSLAPQPPSARGPELPSPPGKVLCGG